MSCEPLKKITEPVSIETELSFQYDRLLLIFNNYREHEFVKGFKYCMEIVEHNIKENAKS